ncbi:phosphoglycerate mutase-like protein [Exidia glandulosa HHB12029]|uniref:Phosphoglycerate mutase-like protein n=1 Tax=Exidia glandulosa HHB12029 TaxID=1314781 RepID=A0A165JV79_EXIGL|nr:phosphoglycerate mutase-like protein [Exidia glandulosa HHB12029]
MTVTIYFIRHGQSEDNLRPVWAGWKDAPLSDLGQRQAAALGAALSTTPFDAIFASDLKRAHSTARAVFDATKSDPKPPFTVTQGLREQYFGVAEGHAWVDSPSVPLDASKNIFPILYGRDEKFPEGESLNDLRARTVCEVLEPLLMPIIWASRGKKGGDEEVRVACTSHGLCISELCAAIVSRVPEGERGSYPVTFAGLANTAWHCLRVGVKGEDTMSGDEKLDVNAPLTVEVVKLNDYAHLHTIATADAQPVETSKLREYLSGKSA